MVKRRYEVMLSGSVRRGGVGLFGRQGRPAGFTLLEVLVAMLILSIIVIIMGNIFRHSAIAWNSGMQKTQISMEGRAVMDLMSRELSQAVMDGVLSSNDGSAVRIGGPEGLGPNAGIQFFTLSTPDSTNREVLLVQYKKVGDTVQRRQMPVVNTLAYPIVGNTGHFSTNLLVNNVSELSFNTLSNRLYTTNLPSWIDIEMVFRRTDTNSAVRVWSWGPNKRNDNGQGDDIVSWLPPRVIR